MAGVSITQWSWLKWPGAVIENGLITEGIEQPIPYYPGENITELLNAVQSIYDEKSALEFVRRWGLLGLRYNVSAANDLSSRIAGAVEFTYSIRQQENLEIDLDTINREVLQYFNPEGGFSLTQKGDSLSGTLEFARWVRYIAGVKRLLLLYQVDKFAADYEANEWLGNLSVHWCNKYICSDMDFLKRQYKEQLGSDFNDSEYYQYVLRVALGRARDTISGRGQRGVWIALYKSPIAGRPEGFPTIQFDGLFRFIAYVLLINGGPTIKQCADPKCKQLFFPTKSDQEYCPPPIGVKRSRCENRHGQWLRRNGIQKPKTKKLEV